MRTCAALHAELDARRSGGGREDRPNDQKRTIRALEVFRLTGEPM